MTGLSDATVAELAAALHAARKSGVPIEPLTDSHPGMSVTDAYRIQRDLVSRLLAGGDRIVGYKLGLTSLPMQRMFGVGSPDFAPVPASHVHADGAELTAGSFIQPRVEAEIALVLSADLAGPDCTALDVARAVAGAVTAIEIVDSRICGWRIKLADTIADLASSGAIVLGRLAGADARRARRVAHRWPVRDDRRAARRGRHRSRPAVPRRDRPARSGRPAGHLTVGQSGGRQRLTARCVITGSGNIGTDLMMKDLPARAKAAGWPAGGLVADAAGEAVRA